MSIEIDRYETIAKKLKKEYPNLSDYERLSLSVQIERNQILANGLNVSYSDKHPASLEDIAISLRESKRSE